MGHAGTGWRRGGIRRQRLRCGLIQRPHPEVHLRSPCSYPDARAYAYTNPYTYATTYADTNANTGANAYCYPNANANANTGANAYCYPNANAYCYPNANANSDSDS